MGIEKCLGIAKPSIIFNQNLAQLKGIITDMFLKVESSYLYTSLLWSSWLLSSKAVLVSQQKLKRFNVLICFPLSRARPHRWSGLLYQGQGVLPWVRDPLLRGQPGKDVLLLLRTVQPGGAGGVAAPPPSHHLKHGQAQLPGLGLGIPLRASGQPWTLLDQIMASPCWRVSLFLCSHVTYKE